MNFLFFSIQLNATRIITLQVEGMSTEEGLEYVRRHTRFGFVMRMYADPREGHLHKVATDFIGRGLERGRQFLDFNFN